MNLTYTIMLPMAVTLAALGGPATANDGRAAATGLSTSYGQSLLGAAHLRHPEIAYAQMVVTTAEGAPIKIERRWGFEPSREQKHELVDAIGNDIGTLTLGLRCQKLTNVDAVAGELSRRIYSAASLLESDPFVAGATRAPAAQAMIDEALRHDPSIITWRFT